MDGIDGDDLDVVKNMINSLENGEEPIMLKICSGTATRDEINKWAMEQGLDNESLGDVIDMLRKSFTEGEQIAENIDDDNKDHNNDNNIMNRLNNILLRLDGIKLEVMEIVNIVNNQNFKNTDI